MNRSSTMTERLKFATSPSSRFMVTNARMSGCPTFRIPMFAPRRRPPCLITSVAALKTRMNETGPEATPSVDCTGEPSGRICEKLYPVPPPVLWMIAPYFMLSKIPSIESGTGRVKQAESWRDLRAGVHQRRGVREEPQADHRLVERRPVLRVLREGRGDPPTDVLEALLASSQVPRREYAVNDG